MQDVLHPFLFTGLPVRGALVQVSAGWREVLKRREGAGAFPPPVEALLGEMVAAGILMFSSIKFDGRLILQLHGDGPLKLGVVEVSSGLRFRATARIDGTVLDGMTLPTLANQGRQGRCAITLDPSKRQAGSLPYQGIVPLFDDSGRSVEHLASALEHYMLQSEQLDTRLMLAADESCAAGLLLQRMPTVSGRALGHDENEAQIGRNEDFNRIATLGSTVTPAELLQLDPDTLLRRLFWEEPLERFAPRALNFECSCGRERVRDMLVGLGQTEVEDILAEQGQVEVGCDFCGNSYRFDAVDVGDMFTADLDQGGATTRLQ